MNGASSSPGSSTILQADNFRLSRRFPITRSLLGKDGLRPTECVISDSICDLCLQFVKSSLCDQKLEFSGSRWVFQCFGEYGEEYRLVFNHYSLLRALKQSAKSGCPLCQTISRSPNFTGSEPMILCGRAQDGRGSKFGHLPQDFSSFSIRPQGKTETKGNDQTYAFILAKDEAECFRLPTRLHRNRIKYPSHCSDSVECFDRIQSWYSTCKETHERCTRERLPLPLRLLDVQVREGPTDKVFLRISSELQKENGSLDYLALSYCWGGMSEFRTLQDNMADRMNGTPLLDFPAVLRDAVTVTRKCGIGYLWVDALCICQDDEQEWELQSAAMADIYGGSVFTISALSSPNVNHGFLRSRNISATAIGQAELDFGTWKDTLTLYVRKQPRSLMAEFELGDLNQRAWPLQERILPPAVLHYGRDQLIWECNTCRLQSETGETRILNDMVIRLSDMSGAPDQYGNRDLWDCIVDLYTGRKLSIPSDRLRALSGLVSKLRKDQTRRGRFVAGLWESDLEFQLLWASREQRNTNYGESVKPNRHVSTWSWAHRNLKAYSAYRHNLTSCLAESPKFRFDDPEHDQQSQDARHIVASCAISLTGFVQKVGDMAIRVESQPLLDLRRKTKSYAGLPGADSRWFFDHEPLGPGPHYCLRMMHFVPKSEGGEEYHPVVTYLVLELENLSPMGHHYTDSPSSHRPNMIPSYRRVGVLRLGDPPKECLLEPYSDILFENGKPLLTDGKWQELILV